MPKKVAVGIVTSDKMAKTRRVEIARLVKHPKYGKILRQKTVCFVHDENEDSAVGDTVEIIESPPKSKKKRWNLVRVIEKSRAVDVAALRAAQKSGDAEALAAAVGGGAVAAAKADPAQAADTGETTE